jgi:TonB-linked SusC/RagA family outer membrane protein
MQKSKRTITTTCLLTVLLASSVTKAQQTTPDTAVVVNDTVPVVNISKHVQDGVKVSGRITSAATGEPLQGISVKYKNYAAAITDASGRFSIYVPDYSVAVLVEGSGYQSKEIALKGRSGVAASLYEDTFNSFYDAATLPFGNVPRNKIPYSVTSVQATNAWEHSFETPDTYLQGRVAGLNTIRRSGNSNIGANLFLHGYNSLYATNQPLIVVDGVIFDNTNYGNSLIAGYYSNPLSFIDIRDIDNITVIKDGGSIYGTKGANGVIMITTARAKELATKIDFAVYGGLNFAPENLPILKSADYRAYLSQLLQTRGLTTAQIQAQPYMNDDPSNPDYYIYHNETDWQKQVLQNSSSHNYYLKITGGDNIAKYALSLGYLKNSGVIANTDMTRYNTRFNADLNLSRKLVATTNLSFTFNEQDLRNEGNAEQTNPLYLSLIKAPFLGVHEVSNTGVESPDIADRDIFNVSNPLALINNSLGINKGYRFSGSIGFNYKIVNSLGFNTVFGVTVDKVRETFFIPEKGVAIDTLNTAVSDNESGSQVQRVFTLFNDSRLSYSKTFNRVHELSANLGFRFMRSQSEQDIGLGFNSATDELKSVSFGLSTLRRVGGNLGEWRWLNNYLNADYKLMDKYFVSFNMAFDGSSRFGSDVPGAAHIGGSSYALLPSVGAGWLLSSEKFMTAFPFIESLKLRGSLGFAGNDDIGNYNNRQFYVSQNLLGIQGLVRGNYGNNQLQWEEIRKINAGIDLSMFNERFNLSFDYYKNRSYKMLINEPVQAAAGMVFAVSNTGGMKSGGIEATVSGRIINKTDLKWDLGFNIARYKSRVVQLPVESLETSFGGATMLTKVGASPNRFFGWMTNGVYATDAEAAADGFSVRTPSGNLLPFKGGDVRFIDRNGDQIIDEKDREIIGNPNPDFSGGFNSRVEWKRLTFDVLFTFSKGNDVFNFVRQQRESMSGFENQSIATVNSWKKDGDVTNMPKVSWNDPMGNARFSQRWIEDGSYLRLRTASVSYRLPVKEGFLKYFVLYLTGNNLFTLTKYLGYDPEFSANETVFGQGIDLGLTPQFRSVQLGLRIGL